MSIPQCHFDAGTRIISVHAHHCERGVRVNGMCLNTACAAESICDAIKAHVVASLWIQSLKLECTHFPGAETLGLFVPSTMPEQK